MEVQSDQPENNYCKVCGHVDEYYDEFSEAYHNNSPKHISNQILKNYKDNKLYFSKNRDGIVVTCSAESKPLEGFTYAKLENIDQHKIRMHAKPNQGVRFSFTIKNEMTNDDFLVVGIQLAHPQPQFVLNDNPYVFGADPHVLEKKSTLKGAVFCEFKAEDIGQYEMPIMFTFHRESIKKNLIIIREMVITVQEGHAENIFTKSPYTAEDWEKAEKVIRANEIMPSTLYKVPKLLKILIPRGLGEQSLESLNLPTETIGQLNQLRNTTRDIIEEGPTPENYMAYFHHLLWWEEVIGRINLRKYNMSSVVMGKRGPYYALQVPGLAEKRPSLLRGDYLFIRPKVNLKIIFEGKIKEMEDSTILISGVNEGLAKYYSPTAEFDVRFLMSRVSLERMHEAVSRVFTSKQDTRIFPTPPKKIVQVPNIKKFYNPLIVANEEQRTAVEHIVAGSSGLAPYIVFGPPGTGKTMTIVEAVVQLVAMNPKNRIMVCTDSNMAADHVALTLLQYNKQLNISNFILRANSRTREWSVMPPALQSVSNGSSYENSFSVSNEYASKFRIFVTTLLHAAKYWPKNSSASALKISHLFIDEAAQSTEPATLVPLTGLLSASGRLVLAGDPQQLGPVVISREANHRGLGQSLLKRLRTTYENLYTDDPNFITMLVKNFRSDPDILAIPNELFYSNALQPRAKPDSLSKVSILGLPGGERAVVFHAVNSMEQRMGDAPSFFNEKELDMLKRYTLALISKHNVSVKDIGIIAPYIRQVYKIKHWLSSMNYKDIEVGTVESFQGKEKRVILVSTVRANCRLLDYDAKYGLGFLVNDKRYNVTLTRAKAKLIIIGNPTCLARDSKWRKYMEFCKQNHCYFGQETQQLERTADLLTEIARTRFDKCRLTDELKTAKSGKKIAK